MSSALSIYPLPGRKRKASRGKLSRRQASRPSMAGSISNRVRPTNIDKVYEFVRFLDTTTTMQSGGITFGASGLYSLAWTMQFNLMKVVYVNASGATIDELVPAYTDFSNLFDQVMLKEVRVQIRAVGAAVFSSSLTEGNGAVIGTAIDYNESNNVSATNDLRQNNSYRVHSLNQNSSPYPQCTRIIKPKYLTKVYYTTVLDGYTSNRGYVRSDYDIPHYGLKGIVSSVGNNQTITFNVRYTYLCKNCK